MTPEQLRALLAENIRRVAQERQMALNHVADFAGVSQSHFYAVLRAETSATTDWIAKIASALGVAPSSLLAQSNGDPGS